MNLSDSIKNLKNKIEDINNKVTKLIESSNLANAKAKDNETKVENVINTTDNNLKNINENMKKINIINDELYSIEDTFLKLTNTDYIGKTTNFIDVYPSKFMIFGGAKTRNKGDGFTGSSEDWDDSSQKALVKIKISNENETKDLVYKIPSTLKNIENIAFDRLDLVNMKLYQKCDMLKLTGSESWEEDTTVTHNKKNTIAFKMSIDGKGALKPSGNDKEAVAVSNNDNFIVYSCNILNGNDIQCFCFTQGGLLKIQIKKSSLVTQDVNGFKTWLSTANLIIFFEKASESVIDITGEKIKLCPNATVEMTNAVKPSKVEIKYKGSVVQAFEELDDKIEALKSTQSLEYEGENVTCENTLASRTSDMLIKGKTYQNTDTGGIESAGEKKNKISILSHNKNLVDPNKLFLNNSSIIKENGAFICPPNVSWQSEKIMGVDLSKPLYFAYEIKSDENIIIDKTNQNLLIRLDYVKTGGNIGQTNIPIGAKITNEYTKFIFKNISLSNTDREQGINLVFRNGVGKKIYIRNITISNTPIDDVIPYRQDKKEILLPIDGDLKCLPNGVADTIEQRNDGVYLVQRVGKVVLNGSEAWTKSSWNMTNVFKFDFEIGLIAKLFDLNATNQILCDTFKVVSRNSLDNVANREFEGICPSNAKTRTLSISILKSKLNNTNTTDAFKQWLRDNPVTVCYELNTSVETKLDINNLDLEVYKDITYVTTDNAIQPTLSFKVPSSIGGVIQENAQNINKLYKYNHSTDKPTIPSLDEYAKTSDVNTSLSNKVDKTSILSAISSNPSDDKLLSEKAIYDALLNNSSICDDSGTEK